MVAAPAGLDVACKYNVIEGITYLKFPAEGTNPVPVMWLTGDMIPDRAVGLFETAGELEQKASGSKLFGNLEALQVAPRRPHDIPASGRLDGAAFAA